MMKGFDLYRITMAYLGVIFVMCALVVFNPLRWVWPPVAQLAVQEVATPVITPYARDDLIRAATVDSAQPAPSGSDVGSLQADMAAEGPVDPAEVVASLVAQSFGDQFGEILGEGDIAGQTDADLSPQDALVAAGSDVAYTIGPGDSLGSLALRFYGDSTLSSVIFEANRGLMKSPDQLRVGQLVIIPGRS